MRIVAVLGLIAALSACATQPNRGLVRTEQPQNHRGFTNERTSIAALRAANNQAMSTRDLNGTMNIVADDYVIVAGNSGITRSSEDMRARWSKTFSDPTRLPCIRKPEHIEVGQNAGMLRAAERGQWKCPSTAPSGEANYYGSYFAHWKKSAGKWVVVSDNYVTLGCAGKGCVP